MKVAIVYPPFMKDGKIAFLSQNRYFKYSNSREVALYPVVLATGATMLKQAGHEVLWLDGINEGLSFDEFDKQLAAFDPDLIVTETKAPVVKEHWKWFEYSKRNLPDALLAIAGDHVTCFPEETLDNSIVDHVLAGGDYDFLLRDLVSYLSQNVIGSTPGIWTRQNGRYSTSRPFELDNDLDDTPIPDRKLTKWWLYREADFYEPSARVMFGRGCGGVDGRPGFCTFCIWVHSFWKLGWRLRSPEHCVAEVKELVEDYGVKEVFDDTDGGACLDKDWLIGFQREMKEQDLIGKVFISSNVRGDVLQDPEICELMVSSGYRMVKPAVEAGTNATLKKIGKDCTIEEIVRGIKTAKDHGLVVHLSAMVGYPWETENDVKETYEVMKELMLYKTRAGDSLQASIIMPYPGTPLWRMARKNGWLKIREDEYEKLDMESSVMSTNDIHAKVWTK
ncbi:MAG: radical SAM protein, partial [Anaerolineales bacterium]